MNELNVARVVPVADIGKPVERLAILFDGHYDRLYRLARRLTASADDALDLVQETQDQYLSASQMRKLGLCGC
jgi:Sigma-70 region 2